MTIVIMVVRLWIAILMVAFVQFPVMPLVNHKSRQTPAYRIAVLQCAHMILDYVKSLPMLPNDAVQIVLRQVWAMVDAMLDVTIKLANGTVSLLYS